MVHDSTRAASNVVAAVRNSGFATLIAESQTADLAATADQFTGLMREYWKVDQEKQWEVDSLRAQSEHFRLMLERDPAE
jgi:hypothetical protein